MMVSKDNKHGASDSKKTSTASFQQKFGKNLETEAASEADQETEMITHPSYEELQQQLTEMEQKAEKANEYWDKILRMQAEMQNLQRRSELDLQKAHLYGLEKFVLELLPVVDNLERAIASHANEPHEKGDLFDGVELTLKMFCAALNKFGVKEVNPEKEAFNPEFHQAVSTIESPKDKPGTIVTVLQKGYILNNRLIRPALVIVAK